MISAEQICPSDAWKLTQEGVLLVDVRETDEVSQERYEVSRYMHLSLSELPQRFREIPNDKKVIIACRSGIRSQKAIDFLLSQGYEKLCNLEGGILAWKEQEFPIV